ncbi:MAG: cupin domain-containing protein [Candidatus Bathyarchaeia archaeon]
MSEPVVVRPSDVEHVVWPGGGQGRRMITPDIPGSKNLLVGIIYVDPGKIAHRWHTHTRDKAETFEIIYPETFEEAYLIIKGRGTLCWRVRGEEKRMDVKEGDAIYFPIGVVENQVVNTGEERMVIVYVATPPVRVVKF